MPQRSPSMAAPAAEFSSAPPACLPNPSPLVMRSLSGGDSLSIISPRDSKSKSRFSIIFHPSSLSLKAPALMGSVSYDTCPARGQKDFPHGLSPDSMISLRIAPASPATSAETPTTSLSSHLTYRCMTMSTFCRDKLVMMKPIPLDVTFQFSR